MGDIRSTIQQTINSFVENNTLAVKKKDTSLLSVALSEDCIRMYRPLSILRRYPQFFKAELKNADFEAQMKIELLTMEDASQNVTRTVIDADERKATIWSEQTVVTNNGQSVNTIEVVFDFDFTEDGTKITRIMEFIDTYESTKVIEEILSNAAAAK